MSPPLIQAIDVHAHYGNYLRDGQPLLNEFMSGGPSVVLDRARQSNVRLTVVSPLLALMPRFRADAVAGNAEARRVIPQHDGLRQWVVIHPLQPRTYDQADDMLRDPWCAGIKIHPEEHGYPIKEHGRAIFEFAASHNALVLTHTGEANSMPEDFVPYVNDFPSVRLILAHLGHGHDSDPSHQVRAIQSARNGNVYVDTSSARSILPGLVEWAVQEIGPQRILFGTDSPLYCTAMQRTRIDTAHISESDKQLILHDNAARLLSLKEV